MRADREAEEGLVGEAQWVATRRDHKVADSGLAIGPRNAQVYECKEEAARGRVEDVRHFAGIHSTPHFASASMLIRDRGIAAVAKDALHI